MTRRSSSRLLDLDPEIEWTFRRRLKSAEDIVRNLNFDEQFDSKEATIEVKEESSVNRGDLEIETMAEERKTMVEYARPTLESTGSCIVYPAIAANNIEVKASTMNMIHNQCQFDGLSEEDPHAHI